MGHKHVGYVENLRQFQEDLRRKNKIRDKFKKERVKSVSAAQLSLFRALEPMGKEYEFKVVKEREIYTKEGVRFADLFIKKYGLIIEVDGGYHATVDQREKDLQRDAEIWSKKRIITLRFSNEEVWGKMENVLRSIGEIVSRLSDLPHYKSPGKGTKKLANTIARKKIYNELRARNVL